MSKKITHIYSKPKKVTFRSQEEITKSNKKKREDMLKNIRKNK